MAQTTAISANAVKNRGGTLRYGGNVDTANNPITNVPALSVYAPGPVKYGSFMATGLAVTMATTGDGLVAANFGKMVVGQYLQRGVGVTSQIAGLSKNTLYFAASDYGRKSILKSELDRRSGLSGWAWNITSSGTVFSGTKYNKSTTFSNDEAARPTRAVPGELVFRDGSKTPFQADYKEKTS